MSRFFPQEDQNDQVSKGLKTKNKALILIGIQFIVVGLLCNEWLLSALFSSDGDGIRTTSYRIIIWIFDLALISWGSLTILFCRTNLMINVNLLFETIILILILLEASLRISPAILGRHFANGILTKYTIDHDGIYFTASDCRGKTLNFMKPNFNTTMYYNGYTWRHETDKYGFRNLRSRDHADIILLGDSFIYGHGLNIDKTVGVLLEKNIGYSVMNMARQGDCSFQETYLLSQYITHFKPRYVIYFFYENDITDLYFYLSTDEMVKFIQQQTEDVSACHKDNLPHLQYSKFTPKPPGSKSELKPYILRIFDWLSEIQRLNQTIRKVTKASVNTSVNGADASLITFTLARQMTSLPQTPALGNSEILLADNEVLSDNDNPDSLGWKYTTNAILKMKYLSELYGATFVIAPITPTIQKHYRIIEDISRKYKIQFIETDIINESDPSLFLPHDGHLSEKGANVMAMLVSSYLSSLSLPLRNGL